MKYPSKTILVTAVASLAIGAGLDRYLRPLPGTQTVEVTRDVVRTDVRTIVKVVEKPDGTKESITETVDHSVNTNTSSSSSTIYLKPNWLVGATVASKLAKLEPVYGVLVQRRIIGPVFAGGSVKTDGEFGLTIGMEF